MTVTVIRLRPRRREGFPFFEEDAARFPHLEERPHADTFPHLEEPRRPTRADR